MNTILKKFKDVQDSNAKSKNASQFKSKMKTSNWSL